MLRPFCIVQGQGPDLVLLHGWGLHGGIFDLLLPELVRHYRVHVIDLPGFGRSGVNNTAYTLAYLADAVSSVMPERAHLLGWSLGGMVATQIARQNPSAVLSLSTVASNVKFSQSEDWIHATRTSVLEGFTQSLAEDYESTLIKFLSIATMGSETQKEDIKCLKASVFIHGLPAPAALRGGLDILRNADQRTDLAHINVPVLRLYGRLDALVPVAVVQDIQALQPDGKFHIFRKASHAPFLSHQQEFVEVLNNFLNSVPTALDVQPRPV